MQERLTLMLEQLMMSGIGVVAVFLLYAAMSWVHKEPIMLISFVVAYFPIFAHRYIVRSQFKKALKQSAGLISKDKLKRFSSHILINYTLSGLLLGIYSLYIVAGAQIHNVAYVFLCVAGCGCASLIVCSYLYKCFVAYTLCSYLPLAFYTFINYTNTSLFYLSIITLVFVAMLLGLAKKMSRNTVSAISLRYKNTELLNQIKHTNIELENYASQLEKLSTVDALTGLYNRLYFDQVYDVEWKRALRVAENITVVMCDIDLFKHINDTYGHLVGDKCLKGIAQKLQSSFRRAGDVCIRFGGEEFVILLPNTPAKKAYSKVERIRHEISNMVFSDGKGTNFVITVSFGLASCQVVDEQGGYDLVEKADKALYNAKLHGRNCVEIDESSMIDNRNIKKRDMHRYH